MPLTSFAIQNRLFETLQRKGHEIICPNYTPAHWFESDVFSITSAGYSVEHEIKLTVQDFERDALKGDGSKHRRLAAGDPHGPKYFWFVVPEGMETKITVPEWAGLKMAVVYGRSIRTRIAKKAPALHSVKVDSKVLDHVRGIFYWRFWNLRRK